MVTNVCQKYKYNRLLDDLNNIHPSIHFTCNESETAIVDACAKHRICKFDVKWFSSDKTSDNFIIQVSHLRYDSQHTISLTVYPNYRPTTVGAALQKCT